MDKEKKMRVFDEELSILKNTFADNDVLLTVIRNLFFGLPVSTEDKELITKVFKDNEQLRKLMRKMFLPELDPEIPVGQTIDLWLSVDIRDKDDYEVHSALIGRSKLISFLEQSLSLFEDVEAKPVDLSIDHKKIETYTKPDILARNSFVTHIEQQLLQIKILSGKKDETVEQVKERLKKDSTK